MATFRADPIDYLTGNVEKTTIPQAVSERGGGGKFTSDGAVLPFPGVTFVCHVDPKSQVYQSLKTAQKRLMEGDHAHHFTFLPPPSFHMTIFSGFSGPDHALSGWPNDLSTKVSRKRATRIIDERIGTVRLPTQFKLQPIDMYGGFSLTLSGFDEKEERLLRGTRALIRELTEIRQKDFERYTFHITLGYLLRWLDKKTAKEVISYSDAVFKEFSETIKEINLGPIEFCRFQDMHYFEPIRYLTPDLAIGA